MESYVRPKTTGSRGYSQELFRGIASEAMLLDPHYGLLLKDDFDKGVQAGWTKTNLNSSTSTFTATAGRGGLATLDIGATTNNHGSQVQLGAGSFKVAAGKDLAFEALLKITASSTAPKLLIGLASTDSALLGASGGEEATDFIGFYAAGTDLNLDFMVVDNGTPSDSKQTVTAYVNDTWIKLGFMVTKGKIFTPFVNGVPMTDDIITLPTSTDLPELWLAPSLAVVGSGTTRPTIVCDWVMAAQKDETTILV